MLYRRDPEVFIVTHALFSPNEKMRITNTVPLIYKDAMNKWGIYEDLNSLKVRYINQRCYYCSLIMSKLSLGQFSQAFWIDLEEEI